MTTNSRSTDIFDLLADVMIAKQEPWRDLAACKGTVFVGMRRNEKGEVIDNLFFPKESAGGDKARKMCETCPVVDECKADHGKQPAASQHYGIWYGTRPSDREDERKSAESLTAAA